jgi:hypothetical protein
MSDGNNLYFVRILQAAFLERDRTRALKSAMEEIISLGNAPEYREGYRNFQNLMKALENEVVPDVALVDDVTAETLEARMLDIVTNSIEGSEDDKQVVMQLIQENPELRLALQEMRNSLAILFPGDPAVEIEVEKDGVSFGLYRLEAGIDRIVIPGIQEGEYAVKLSTGLLLWRGRVKAKDILWQLAFPGQKLPAAAETKMLRQQPILASDLLDGEVRLELFPSLESGTIVLTFKRPNGS